VRAALENAQIDVYWTDGRCPGFPNLQAGQCTVLARAEGVTKPKRLTFNNTTANAVYNFWIYNAGSSQESGALEVGVTTNGPVVVASPTPLPGGGGGSTDPRANLPAGPVTQAKVAVRSIDTGGFNYRDATQDDNGNWIVHPGEFVVFDFSQRNGAGEKCQWIHDPEWDVSDDDEIVEVRGQQPALPAARGRPAQGFLRGHGRDRRRQGERAERRLRLPGTGVAAAAS
jgi:hypothetical protein